MKREIKFRAWDEEHKRMVEHPFVVSNEGKVFEEYRGGGYVKDFKLMQYTGLKDKNGVEIYEGDIVKAYGRTVKVRFEHGAFIIGYHDGSSTPTRPQLIQGMAKDVATKIEIIGNIYQNPELLK